MIYLFYFFGLTGLAYFLAAKRRPDAFLVAYASALVYFLPGFFGYVAEPRSPDIIERVPVSSETYLVYIIVMTGVCLSALLSDVSRKKIVNLPSVEGERGGVSVLVVAALFFILAANTVFLYDSSVLSPYKSDVVSGLPYLHKYLVLYSVFAAIYFLIRKRYALLSCCLLVLAWDVYLGFRSNAAFFVIGAFVVYLYGLGRIRLGAFWYVHGLGLISAMFLFSYKSVYASVKRGDYSSAIERLFSVEGVVSSIKGSEPFVTQGILNRVLENGYRIPLGSVQEQFVAAIPFSRTLLDFDALSFNQYFQKDLFPGVGFGMANNWWAYWYSSFGWGGILVGLSVVLFGCFVGNYLLRAGSRIVVALSGVLIAIGLFYIHRNDVLFTFGLSMQVVAMVSVTLVILMIVHSFLNARFAGDYRLSPGKGRLVR